MRGSATASSPSLPALATRAYLDQGVDHAYIGIGIEHLVEVGLSIDQFQLVKLLVILTGNQVVSIRLKSTREERASNTRKDIENSY